MKKIAIASVSFGMFAVLVFSASTLVPMNLAAQSTAPAAPTNVSATAGDGSATVTFTGASGFDFSTKYTAVATALPYPSVTSSPSSSTTIVISGLTNGRTYTISVTATNSSGTSLYSTPSNPVTPKASTSTTTTTNTNPGAAQDININFQLKNPLGSTGDLNTFLENILHALVLLLTPVVVIMLLYSGFLFVSARGNAEKLGEAKKALLYTLIGAAIVLGAQGIATVLSNTVTCLAGAAGC